MSALQILLIAVGGAALFAALVILLVAAKLYRFAIVRQKAAQTEKDGLPYERMMRKNKKEKYLPLVRAGVDWMRERGGSVQIVVRRDRASRRPVFPRGAARRDPALPRIPFAGRSGFRTGHGFLP